MITTDDEHYNQLSDNAKRLIYQQYGFRTDAQSVVALGTIKPVDTIDYECNELENDDIPYTLNHLYNTNFQLNHDRYDPKAINQFIREQLKLKADQPYYLIWLVEDWHSCFEFYTDGHNWPKTMYDHDSNFDLPFIDVYQIHADDFLVSDCGVDGQLIATKNLPKSMHGFNH